MKAITQFFILLIIGSALGLYMGGCVHEPATIATDPTDTNSNPVDTNAGNPCDPNRVYFDKQVLPLLLSSCAVAGCHDPITREDGVVLNSFENVINTGDIKAFDPGGSKLYKMITENDLKKRMPPPPFNALSADQKKIIADWIRQGATNDKCNQSNSCDTLAVSFSKTILPIINTHCKTCHSGSTPFGNVFLTNFAEVRNYALNGKLVCVINWNNGCPKMPSGGQKLDDCSINQIENWINQGSQNN